MDTYAAGCARTYTGWKIQATVTDNTYQDFRTNTENFSCPKRKKHQEYLLLKEERAFEHE